MYTVSNLDFINRIISRRPSKRNRKRDYASQQGYYVSGQGTSWSLFSDGARSLGLSVEHGTISESYIKNNLSSKTPMICSMKPGDFTYTGHFIVLTGIDSEGNVIVNDPNSPNNSIKQWKIETLVTQIKDIFLVKTLGYKISKSIYSNIRKNIYLADVWINNRYGS